MLLDTHIYPVDPFEGILMLKLTKVTCDHFEHENTEDGFYVSIHFRRGMYAAYISDDITEQYTAMDFDSFLHAHVWADAVIDGLDGYRRTGISIATWVD